MKFFRTKPDFPLSFGVVQQGKFLETVLVSIRPGESKPVEGGVQSEMQEIFRQLDELLTQVGVDKTAVTTVRLYVQDINRDIGAINEVYQKYFGQHPPVRRAYGVDLQRGMLVEAAFVAEIPDG